jgi:anti-anti-sigma factor
MNYEVEYQDDFLIIKLCGTVGSNERLLSKKALLSTLQPSYRKVIVDLRDLRSGGGGYCVGVLNTIKKEVQLLGGKMKICSLSPAAARYFRENRLDEMFEIEPCIEHAKRSFREERND